MFTPVEMNFLDIQKSSVMRVIFCKQNVLPHAFCKLSSLGNPQPHRKNLITLLKGKCDSSSYLEFQFLITPRPFCPYGYLALDRGGGTHIKCNSPIVLLPAA